MKRNGPLSRLFILLVFLFLYAPIFVLIVFSFNDSKSRTVWTGFSLHWYRDLFSDSRILNSLATTLEVSLLAMIFATILGTAAAVGFASMRRKPRAIVMAINNIPMTNADIITGVSLMMLLPSAPSTPPWARSSASPCAPASAPCCWPTSPLTCPM